MELEITVLNTISQIQRHEYDVNTDFLCKPRFIFKVNFPFWTSRKEYEKERVIVAR